MPNFHGFSKFYLTDGTQPILYINVNLIARRAESSPFGPERFPFSFDLEDMPNVMENIMAFEVTVDPKNMLAGDLLDTMTKMYIKNALAGYLTMVDKDTTSRYFQLEGRLLCLENAMDDLWYIEEKVDNTLAGSSNDLGRDEYAFL